MKFKDIYNKYFKKKVDASLTEEDYTKVSKILGPCGKILSATKRQNKENSIVFNGSVCTDTQKVWFGDIDVKASAENLRELSSILSKNIYVLKELDARFSNEHSPNLNKALFSVEYSVS